MLKQYQKEGVIEAGCDEAGRGCLAGDVYAAAVILPPDYTNELLNDSKQLTETKRYKLREIIEHIIQFLPCPLKSVCSQFDKIYKLLSA